MNVHKFHCAVDVLEWEHVESYLWYSCFQRKDIVHALASLFQEEIYSSSYAAAAYLESIGFDKKVYVIGEEGILQVCGLWLGLGLGLG
jgi:hypothetical protein